MTEAEISGLSLKQIPLLEFDPERRAIIEPANTTAPGLGIGRCVLCYFGDVIRQLFEKGLLTPAAMHGSEMGELPLYTLKQADERVGVIQAAVGAPFAAALLEELIARGITEFMVCGGCGVLDREIMVGHLLVPASAVRDEGTSYHYLPASREVAMTDTALRAIIGVLDAHNTPYRIIKTWTTDAIYRETTAKVDLRRNEGCLAVEMETAAYLAVAKFRDVRLGQILYAGDDISGEVWDNRSWQNRVAIREQVFWLTLEACLAL